MYSIRGLKERYGEPKIIFNFIQPLESIKSLTIHKT